VLRILRLMLLLVAGVGSTARAETTLCNEITSLPATISTQGVYCLKHDLNTSISSGAAIGINSNNVTLDCNDFKVGGLAAGVTTNAIGILANGRSNLTIRHCGVRGFDVGIMLIGSNVGGHLIEDNRVDLSTDTGMSLEGDDLVVRRNRILQTGGRAAEVSHSSLYVHGNGQVTDNLLSGITPADTGGNCSAYGIVLDQGPFQVEHNLVTGLTPAVSGEARGIWGSSAVNYPNNIRNNTVISASPVAGYGIDGGTPGPSTCGENTVTHFATDTANCTDAGGNVNN